MQQYGAILGCREVFWPCTALRLANCHLFPRNRSLVLSCCWAQVSTADGRVKVLGREGVERTLRCSAGGDGSRAAATRQLLFLVDRGAIIRVDEVSGLW